MILQFGVEFRQFYELLVSAWAVTFKKQQAMLDIDKTWFSQCVTKLPPNSYSLLEQIRRMDQHILYALLLHSPVAQATDFIAWLKTLSPDEIYEIVYSFEPNGQRKTAVQLHRHCLTIAKGLAAWNDIYFSEINPELLSTLADSAATGQALAKDYENNPQELVKELTQGIIWEAEGVTQLTLIPQTHLSPWSIHEFGADHGVIFYAAPQSSLSSHIQPLARILKAVSDPSRLQILKHIGGEVLSFTDLVDVTGLAKSTVHHHLISLRSAGLLWLHIRDDRSSRYSVRWEAIRQLSPALENYLCEK